GQVVNASPVHVFHGDHDIDRRGRISWFRFANHLDLPVWVESAPAGQGACTRPRPTSATGALRDRALTISRCQSAAPRAPVASAHNAAMPATCGVAMLVPEMVL